MTWVFILRLVVAGLLGTVVGIEREWRVKEAGFRTHFLVSLGSALFMIISQWGFEEFLAAHDGLRLDPSRVAAQVVSGIGFIGAGAIIFHRQIVRGLTTAASLWAISGVGMATGAGMYGVAIAATILTLVGLEVLNLFFGKLGSHRVSLVFSTLERDAVDETLARLREIGYVIVSFELENERTATGIIYRARLLIQKQYHALPVEKEIAIIYAGTRGLLAQVPVERVADFEQQYLDLLDTKYRHEVLDKLRDGILDDDVEARLRETAATVAGQYK